MFGWVRKGKHELISVSGIILTVSFIMHNYPTSSLVILYKRPYRH